jgi:hypothetical protein
LQSIEFISNFSAIQTSIRNTFGFIRINQQPQQQQQQQQQQPAPLFPYNKSIKNNELSVVCDLKEQPSFNLSTTNQTCSLSRKGSNSFLPSAGASMVEPTTISSSEETGEEAVDPNLLAIADCRSVKHPLSFLYTNFINNNPRLESFNPSGSRDQFNGSSRLAVETSSINNKGASSSSTVTTPVSHSHSHSLNRSKMIYHCKFGEFGINDGQFTEPSGVTINTNNDIIVADTNSHRIQVQNSAYKLFRNKNLFFTNFEFNYFFCLNLKQIFDKDGTFKFKFGECGKRDGQLLYPNRVSVVKATGDIVVTERSPTHQIQIYSKYGAFLRKFGANILQHPRGVYVDYKS